MPDFNQVGKAVATPLWARRQARGLRSLNPKTLIRYLLILIPIGVAGNLAFFYVQSGRGTFQSMVAFSPPYLLLSGALALVPWLTTAVRTQLWTRFLGETYSLREIIPISIGCDLGSAITPTGLGGGYVKLAMLVEKGMAPGKAASLMTVMTVEDFFFFLAAIPAGLILSPPAHSLVFESLLSRLKLWKPYVLFGLFALLVLVALGIFMNRRRVRTSLMRPPWLARISASIGVIKSDFFDFYRRIGQRGKRILLLNVLLAAVQWICRYSVVTALCASFHLPVRPVDFFLLQWVISTIGAVTPTPGGSVGVEAAFYFFYRFYLPSELVGLVTVAWRFLTFYFQLSLGSLVFALVYRTQKKIWPPHSLLCEPMPD